MVCVDVPPGHKWKETVTLSIALDFWSLGGSEVQRCHLWGEPSKEGEKEVEEEEEEGRPEATAVNLQEEAGHHGECASTFNPSIPPLHCAGAPAAPPWQLPAYAHE